MGISVITIQDDLDGNVTVGFTTEPVIGEGDLSNAQLLGVMLFEQIMHELSQPDED